MEDKRRRLKKDCDWVRIKRNELEQEPDNLKNQRFNLKEKVESKEQVLKEELEVVKEKELLESEK